MKKPASIFLIALLSVIFFNLVGWPFKVRFNYAPLNFWAVVFLYFSLPVAIFLAGWSSKNDNLRATSIIVAVLTGIPSCLIGLFASIEATDIQRNGVDASFIFLREVSSGVYSYRLYRTDCGATCAFGLELRKELITPIGIKLVTPLWSAYRFEKGDISLVTGNKIQVTSEGKHLATIQL